MHHPPAGLCAACTFARVVATRTGSAFLRCGLSDADARFSRYPRLPVLACPGFTPSGEETLPPPDRTSPHQ